MNVKSDDTFFEFYIVQEKIAFFIKILSEIKKLDCLNYICMYVEKLNDLFHNVNFILYDYLPFQSIDNKFYVLTNLNEKFNDKEVIFKYKLDKVFTSKEIYNSNKKDLLLVLKKNDLLDCFNFSSINDKDSYSEISLRIKSSNEVIYNNENNESLFLRVNDCIIYLELSINEMFAKNEIDAHYTMIDYDDSKYIQNYFLFKDSEIDNSDETAIQENSIMCILYDDCISFMNTLLQIKSFLNSKKSCIIFRKDNEYFEKNGCNKMINISIEFTNEDDDCDCLEMKCELLDTNNCSNFKNMELDLSITDVCLLGKFLSINFENKKSEFSTYWLLTFNMNSNNSGNLYLSKLQSIDSIIQNGWINRILLSKINDVRVS